ncbi:MAG: hypothetical protein U0165_08960 [Polyangiaceae bacterium]
MDTDAALAPAEPTIHPARKVTTTAMASSVISYLVCACAAVLTFLNLGSKTTMLVAIYAGSIGGLLTTLLGLGAGFLAVFKTRKEPDSRMAAIARAALYLSVGSTLGVVVLVSLGFVIATLLEGVK